MRPTRLLLLLLPLALLLTGMGSLNGGPVGTVPKADEEIKARLTDQEGVVTALSQFSLDGQTIIEGTRGSAKIAIPLRNIATITLAPAAKKDEVNARIILRDGQEVPLLLRKRLIFNGSTGYGAFVINAGDVRQIDFL